MEHSSSLWRRLSCCLACSLLVALAYIYLLTGYPQEWKKVQVGMSISQVRAICGQSTHSPGLKPDYWVVPMLWGGWVLAVGHGEFTQGPGALVTGIEVYFDYNIAGARLSLRHDWPAPPKDQEAFYKAYGQVYRPE